MKSSKSNPKLKKNKKHLPKQYYKFENNEFNFDYQTSRVLGEPRPNNYSSFLSGNFHFVYKNCDQLKQLNKYEGYLNDLNDVLFCHSQYPNSGIEWNLIYSVIHHQPEDFVCPICLFQPVCPRITQCGHVFCSDCINQHITYNNPSTCPVCFDKISSKNLIRVDLRLFKNNNFIKFSKIKKNKFNTICFLSNSQSDFSLLPYTSDSSSIFSYFSIADDNYIVNLQKFEIKSLQEQILIYKSEEFKDDFKVALLQSTINLIENEYIPKTNIPNFILQPFNDIIYFYQEYQGRLIFLDPLNEKMIKKQFNSLEFSPNEIECNILKSQTFKVIHKYRKIYPFLNHLPTGADITMVLCDFSNIISPLIFNQFKNELEEKLKINEELIPIIENEEIIKELKEEDFPLLFDKDEKIKLKNNNWNLINNNNDFIEEKFPSLNNNQINKSKKDWIKSNSINDNFPTLMNNNINKNEKKKVNNNAWNLK